MRDPVSSSRLNPRFRTARPLPGTSMVLIAYLNMHNRDDNDSARAEHSVVRRAYVTRMQFPYASAYGRSSTIIVRLRGKSIYNSFRDSRLNIYRNLSNSFFVFHGLK